jgi:hypothetical protein
MYEFCFLQQATTIGIRWNCQTNAIVWNSRRLVRPSANPKLNAIDGKRVETDLKWAYINSFVRASIVIRRTNDSKSVGLHRASSSVGKLVFWSGNPGKPMEAFGSRRAFRDISLSGRGETFGGWVGQKDSAERL